MRIIAGSRKSLPLKSVPGNGTRPTPDRIKETLFNIIGPDLYGRRFLDIFAGSGGIGLEALSRGAAFACFVEKARNAVSVIKQNIRFARFEEQSIVVNADAKKCFSSLACDTPYDILFMDPPYRQGFEKAVIENIRNTGWITKETLCIAETAADDDISWIGASGIDMIKIKKYKTNQHIFFHMGDGDKTL